MLLMVIERFGKNTTAIGERFERSGRMLPSNVTYLSSWIDAADPSDIRCFQLMEAPDAAALQPWLDAWSDLAAFEVIPVLTSKDFWAARAR